MAKAKVHYVCQNCGYNSPRFLGRCPNCGEWNTLVEEVEQTSVAAATKATTTLTGIVARPQKINEIDTKKTPRVKTKLRELNRVLGGGIVPGSLVLIGGRSRDWEIDPVATSFWTAQPGKSPRFIYFGGRKRESN